ncbi:LamG-like jellyroll fold domain-containing protein [Gracilinema caldarium]|uniref:LamG-like jellyroll fold domain-containing protein n=1 Tax=Gracilinema caldarium TaxID=215591 RepID=UPI0026E97B20|nr:LamG-like jellyroll fold domain-containing protein [Gracilinema caldarium]
MKRWFISSLVIGQTVLAGLVIAAGFASCTLTTSPSNLSGELGSFRSSYMTTFDVLNNSFTQSGKALVPFNKRIDSTLARATVPVDDSTAITLPTDSKPVTGSQTNYPEVGQTSSWTISKTATANVYFVQVLTTFPSYDPREKQEEWYYILDNPDGSPAALGTWTNADIVVKANGSVDSKFRERNRLYYRDGSYQDEVIVDVKNLGSAFAPFDINGSLDYPSAFVPQTDASAAYASVVVYTRNFTDTPSYSFWKGNRARAIVGIRYYTEKVSADHNQLVGTMIVFEKAITSTKNESGDFLNTYSSLFLPGLAVNTDNAFLALTVVRQQTTYKLSSYSGPATYTVDYNSATRDTRAKTRVVNIATQQDNYVTLINNEAAQITSAYDTVWVPSGDDPEIVNLSGGSVFDKSANQVVTTSDSAPLSIVTSAPLGDFGSFYHGLDDPSSVGIGTTNDIPGDLAGTGDVTVFNGAQGMTLPNTGTVYDFHDKGTIQAWVYLTTPIAYGGIVHAGVKSDFSDEIWSLQFWGSGNDPCFSLSAQTPYKYDYLVAKTKLNTGRWYYLVATWDLAAKQMKLYIDGVLNKSGTFRNVKATSTFAGPATPPVPVVVGSQFFDSTQILNNYYGLNGKINGVLIENRVWSATEIQQFYNNNKAKTAAW